MARRVKDNCLGCERCVDAPMVELWDKRKVCNTCEDWRLECEARRLLTMPMDKIAQELEWRENLHGRDNTKLKRYLRGIYNQR